MTVRTVHACRSRAFAEIVAGLVLRALDNDDTDVKVIREAGAGSVAALRDILVRRNLSASGTLGGAQEGEDKQPEYGTRPWAANHRQKASSMQIKAQPARWPAGARGVTRDL